MKQRWILSIFAKSIRDFELCQKKVNFIDEKKVQLIFCDSNTKDRSDIILQFPNRWLLFIDADCIPTVEAIKKIYDFISTASGADFSMILVGRYLDPVKSNYLQKGHNFIANVWVQSYVYPNSTEIPLLGGIFCLFSDPQKTAQLKRADKKWGGEDKRLGNNLRYCGYSLSFSSELEVIHETSRNFFHFFRRAFLHGFNETKVKKPLIKNQSRITFAKKVSFWFSEIHRTGLVLAPVVLLHFLILALGKLAQLILRRNTLDR